MHSDMFPSPDQKTIPGPWRPASDAERRGREIGAPGDLRRLWLDSIVAAPSLDAVDVLTITAGGNGDGARTIRPRDWKEPIACAQWCGWTEHGGHPGFVRLMVLSLLRYMRAYAPGLSSRSERRREVARSFMKAAVTIADYRGATAADLAEIRMFAFTSTVFAADLAVARRIA